MRTLHLIAAGAIQRRLLGRQGQDHSGNDRLRWHLSLHSNLSGNRLLLLDDNIS